MRRFLCRMRVPSHRYPQRSFFSLSGSKLNFMEGGVRVPLIMRWPGKLEAGRVIPEPVSLMDLLPTFVQLSGSNKPPPNRHLDGKSLYDILLNADHQDNQQIPHHEILYFYWDTFLIAVRYGPYKIHYRWYDPVNDTDLVSACRGGIPFIEMNKHTSCIKGQDLETPLIFHLDHDPAELHPLPPEDHQELLARVKHLATANTASIEKRAPVFNHVQGHQSLLPCCNPPYCACNYTPSSYIVI